MDSRPSSRLTWIHWPAAGLLSGILAGFLDAWLVRRWSPGVVPPDYFEHLAAVQYGLLGVFIGLFGRTLLTVHPALRRFRSHPFAFLFPGALAMVVLGLGNQFFLGAETAPASLAFDAAVGVGAVAAALATWAIQRRRRWLAPSRALATTLVLAAVLFFVTRPAPVDPGGSERWDADRAEGPNVLILMLDTMRGDRVGWGGLPRGTTPHLDALVRKGTAFRSLVSQAPHTKVSCASFLTSLHPTSHGAVDFRGLPESAVTLPEVLSDAGYETFGASANTFISPVFGLHQGFDRLETLPPLVTNKHQFGHILRRLSRRLGHPKPLQTVRDAVISIEKRFYWTVPPDTVELSAPRVIELFREWASEEGRGPFLAYLQFIEPHATYVPPEPWVSRFAGGYAGEPVLDHPPVAGLFAPVETAPRLDEGARINMIDRYDAEIARMDRALGRLFRWLEETGRFEDTLVVLLGDHGESFYEKGMWGHGHSLWDEELKVPFALVREGTVPGNRIFGRDVRAVDVMPTVLDLLAVDASPGMQGASLVAALDGEEGEAPPVYSEIEWSGRKSECLRRDGWKLIRAWDGQEWLYDLRTDPGELRDLAAEHPGLVESLRDEMDAFAGFLAGAALEGGANEQELDEATLDRLRALGYVQ